MKLAIMQPYFFPYMGYFALIKHSDRFILFDTPQFIRHGWIERNRILKPNEEPMYIKVPLKKHHRDIAINDLAINNLENWKQKIFAQLVPYKKKAPNYWKVVNLLKEIFEHTSDSIVNINYHSLLKTSEYLEISTPINIWSKMNVEIDEVAAPDEWALNICKALKANSYINPPGGESFFDRGKYKKAGIDLKFLNIEATPYYQFSNEFVPNLSIIDAIMFNTPDEINHMLNKFKIS